MGKNDQLRIETIDSGTHETVMLAETYISEREMMTLCDSAFVFSERLEENAVVLNTVMSRIQNTAHKNMVEHKEKIYKVKCPITDKEMDILNTANAKINPSSSKLAITKIQNSMVPIDKLYYLSINVTLEFKKEFESCENEILNQISKYMSFNVIGIKDVKPRYKIDTYLTKSEYESLTCELDNTELSKDVKNFCEVLPQATQVFSYEKERKDFISEIENI